MSETMEANPRAVVGGNNPPEETPFELSRDEITDLYDEAANWLDGEPVTTQEVADKIGKLMTDIRAAVKRADERRKDETRPLDEAKAEIQTRYNALIGETKSVTGKAPMALDVCKKALAPFLDEQDRIKKEAARIAAEDAAAKRKAAEDAFRASSVADLAKREEAERLAKEADRATKDAAKAAKDRGRVNGGGRAISSRTYYVAEVTDANAFARHVWIAYREEMQEFLDGLAQRLVDRKVRDIPGVTVTEDKRAV
jgi:hypothetical protein